MSLGKHSEEIRRHLITGVSEDFYESGYEASQARNQFPGGEASHILPPAMADTEENVGQIEDQSQATSDCSTEMPEVALGKVNSVNDYVTRNGEGRAGYNGAALDPGRRQDRS